MPKRRIKFEYEIEAVDGDDLGLNIEVVASLDGEELFTSSGYFPYLLQAIDDARLHADMTIQLLKNAVVSDVDSKYAIPTCDNIKIDGTQCTNDVAQRFLEKDNPFQLCDECADDLQIE